MKAEKNRQKKKSPGILMLILFGIAAGTVLKLFVIDMEKISGTSMEPAIHDGSTVLLSRLHYGLCNPFSGTTLIQWKKPEKGDVVYYWYNDRPVIKRCVATEHESLVFSTDSGYSITVGGDTIPLTEAQYQRLKYSTEVPEGFILAIGDNYAVSIDSREYGFVSVDSIMGKILWK